MCILPQPSCIPECQFCGGEMSGVIISQEHGGNRCITSANCFSVAVWPVLHKDKIFLLRCA